MWWPVIAGPALSALGAATGRRGLARAGLFLSAGSAASFADIARHRIVPGANDNLSGVAVLVARRRVAPGDAGRGRSRPARLVRGGGGPAGRRLRLRRAPSEAARPEQDAGAEPRHPRIAAADHARGRGAGRDGGLLRPRLPRPGRAGRRGRRRRAAARDAGAHEHRRGRAEPCRLPDGDARLDDRLEGAVELPQAHRHARERRLPHGGAGRDAGGGGRARAGRPSRAASAGRSRRRSRRSRACRASRGARR